MTSTKSAALPQKIQVEEIQITVKLPKPLHAKMVQIAAAEGKPLSAKVVQAVREHAAHYERASKTVSSWVRKKKLARSENG